MKNIARAITVFLLLPSCTPFGEAYITFFNPVPTGTISVNDNGAPLSLKETNTITWDTNNVNESQNVYRYEVSLGTSPGQDDTVAWTNVNLSRSYVFTQILNPLTTYYANVRYIDKITHLPSEPFSSPGFASPPNSIEKMVAGSSTTCALTREGKVKCWGANGSGQLGIENTLSYGNEYRKMAALIGINLGAGRYAKDIATSGLHVCAILDNNLLKCWGENNYGQLGYDDTADRGGSTGDMNSLNYVNLGVGRTAKRISAGGYVTCAILDNEKVKCWGYNSAGQLGYDDTIHRGNSIGEMASLGYVNLGVGRTAKSISTNGNSTCAILDNGKLKCWGYNGQGQLGYDDTANRGDNAGEMAALGYVNLGVGRTAKSISSAANCAILDNDQVKCWGDNSQGQLGYNNTVDQGDNPGEMAALGYVNLGLGRTAKKVTGGYASSCAQLDNDQVKCWGLNFSGTLGYDDSMSHGGNPGDMEALGYVNLSAGRTAKDLVAGEMHTCALLDNNQFKCWGYNVSGQLGYDNSLDLGASPASMGVLNFVNVGISRTVKKISGGSFHTCAILDNDQVKCWGDGSGGQLGNESTARIGDDPGEMTSIGYVNLGVARTAKSISAGRGHTCVILDNDEVKCWGYNASGRLGYDDTIDRGANPGEMAALPYVDLGAGRTAKKISTNDAHTCAILDNDEVKCWGDNYYGQLGYGHTSSMGDTAGEMTTLPYVNLGLSRTAKDIATGQFHTCAILDNDKVKCWGYGGTGQLGYDDTVDRGGNPGEMAALPYVNLGVGRTAKSISAGRLYTCVVLDNDDAKCWGYNSSGSLGQNDTLSRGDVAGSMALLSPIDVGHGRTFKSISARHSHTCGILDNDQVKCWGYNFYGQLGYNDMSDRGSQPGETNSLENVFLGMGRTARSISTGEDHTCAVLDNYQLKCWGNNGGKLGYDNNVKYGSGRAMSDVLLYLFTL